MEEGRWKMEDGRGKQKKKLGEFFLLDSFDTGKDPFHSARGKAAEGFLQGLPGEMFVQKRPHLYPGLPAVDEIPAGEVGLDPAAVIKRHHGSHLGAIDLKKVVLVYHDNLAKRPKTTFCSAGYPPPLEGNSKGTTSGIFGRGRRSNLDSHHSIRRDCSASLPAIIALRAFYET